MTYPNIFGLTSRILFTKFIDFPFKWHSENTSTAEHLLQRHTFISNLRIRIDFIQNISSFSSVSSRLHSSSLSLWRVADAEFSSMHDDDEEENSRFYWKHILIVIPDRIRVMFSDSFHWSHMLGEVGRKQLRSENNEVFSLSVMLDTHHWKG